MRFHAAIQASRSAAGKSGFGKRARSVACACGLVRSNSARRRCARDGFATQQFYYTP
jgi:hypothetical protein